MRLINSLVIAALFSLSTVSLADTDAPVLVKASPEVTFDKVQEIFGHNLDTDDTMLKTLLWQSVWTIHPGTLQTLIKISVFLTLSTRAQVTGLHALSLAKENLKYW